MSERESFEIVNQPQEAYIEVFDCPIPNCNKSFPTSEEYTQHITTSHVTVRRQRVLPLGTCDSMYDSPDFDNLEQLVGVGNAIIFYFYMQMMLAYCDFDLNKTYRMRRSREEVWDSWPEVIEKFAPDHLTGEELEYVEPFEPFGEVPDDAMEMFERIRRPNVRKVVYIFRETKSKLALESDDDWVEMFYTMFDSLKSLVALMAEKHTEKVLEKAKVEEKESRDFFKAKRKALKEEEIRDKAKRQHALDKEIRNIQLLRDALG